MNAHHWTAFGALDGSAVSQHCLQCGEPWPAGTPAPDGPCPTMPADSFAFRVAFGTRLHGRPPDRVAYGDVPCWRDTAVQQMDVATLSALPDGVYRIEAHYEHRGTQQDHRYCGRAELTFGHNTPPAARRRPRGLVVVETWVTCVALDAAGGPLDALEQFTEAEHLMAEPTGALLEYDNGDEVWRVRVYTEEGSTS